jgi:methionyl-tRNA formyltransferase
VKRVLFIGNRPGVFAEITKFKELNLVSVFVLAESFLHTEMKLTDLEYVEFSLSDKQRVFERIFETGFDILISNGCPFIMPVSRMKRPQQLFINVHPSFLPDLRGYHPANGALLYNRRFTGATMHYMDDGVVDTGNVIYQEKLDITDDLDLGLVYYMTFDLESRVFSKGMKRIIEANYQYEGESQTGSGSHYTRSEKDMVIDFESMSDDEIITRVRAFGIKSQGVTCVVNDGSYRVFDAQVVSNGYLLDEFISYPCGALLLQYDDKLLVRTRDGIVKIKSYTKV